LRHKKNKKHCDQLIHRKINKIGVISCQILRLKCTKFPFHWGFAPDPTVEAYSTPRDPLVVFKGPTSKGWRGWERWGYGKPKNFGMAPPMGVGPLKAVIRPWGLITKTSHDNLRI